MAGMPESVVVTRAAIERGLRELGLRGGETLLVHSSLSSFGYVEGGAHAVIDALLAVLGPAGTLCMPALTYGPYTPQNPPPLFDPGTSKGIVGCIPETFRRRPGVMRSLHPTHSMAAVGPNARWLLAGHERSRTPCGPHSPWGKLREVDGRILMIGCGTEPMTMSHGPEEVCHESTRCTAPVRCQIRTDGGIRTVELRLHGPYERPGPGREELERVLEERSQLRRCEVGNSTLLLTSARAVWDVVSGWCERYAARRPAARSA